MDGVRVAISRFVDESYPGLVECTLIDAFGVNHFIVEKIPVVSAENIWSDSEYPRPGFIGCEVEARWNDASGKELVRINTERPWEIESTDGTAVFTVFAAQLLKR